MESLEKQQKFPDLFKSLFLINKEKKINLEKREIILNFVISVLYQLQKKNIYFLNLKELTNNTYNFLEKDQIEKFSFEEIQQEIYNCQWIGNSESDLPIIFEDNKIFFRKNYLEQKKIIEAIKKPFDNSLNNSSKKFPFHKKRVFFSSKKENKKELEFFNDLLLFFKENEIFLEDVLFLTNSYQRVNFFLENFNIESFLISKFLNQKNYHFQYLVIDDFFNISISPLSKIIDNFKNRVIFFGITFFAKEKFNIEIVTSLKQPAFNINGEEAQNCEEEILTKINQKERIIYNKRCHWLKFSEKQVVHFLQEKLLPHYQKYFSIVKKNNSIKNLTEIFRLSNLMQVVTLTQEKIYSFYWLKNFFYYKILKELNICNQWQQEENYIGKKITVIKDSPFVFKGECGILLPDKNKDLKVFFQRENIDKKIVSFFPEEIDFYKEDFFSDKIANFNYKNLFLFLPKKIQDKKILLDLFKTEFDKFYFFS